MDPSPLQDRLKDADAELVEVDEAEVARSYGDVEAEHRAVRQGCGAIDLHPVGVGVFSGPDRREFLHDVMTNATEDRLGEVFDTAYMTADGQIVGYFHLAMLDDASPAVMRGGIEPLADEMEMYLMISDVELDVTDHGVLALQGPDTGDVLDALDLPVPETGWVEEAGDVIVLGVDSTGSGGVWLLAEPDRLGDLWDDALEAGARPVGYAAREALRIEAGRPAWGREVTGDDLPQECGIRDAVDFEKGCYPGQEAVAKLENLGQPRKHLAGLVLDGPVPDQGAPVTADGQLIGEVASAAESPGVGGVVALSLLKRGEADVGRAVEAGDAEGEVVDLPIYQA